MNNKISFIQNIKNYFMDISVYSKDKIHSFIRHKIKIGYRVPKDHEFVPDQSKLGQFGSFLQKRPIFVEINHEQRKKINLKEGKDWVFNPELKDFFELEHIEEGL